MEKQFNLAEAKTRLSELLNRVESGEELIIARSGKPIAKLSPIAETAGRTGFFGVLSHLGPVPDEALEPETLDADFGWEDAKPVRLLNVAEAPAAPIKPQ